MSERHTALIAALEELHVADRILTGIEGAPQTADHRTREALRGEVLYATEDARAINSELFAAQAAVARARALVGLPPVTLVEIPLEVEQLVELAEQGRIWTIADDLALIRSLRRDVRALFATLRGEDPEVARSVAPLAECDPVEDGPQLDHEDEEWPASTKPVEAHVGLHTGFAGLVCFGTTIGLVIAAIAGDVFKVLLGLIAVPAATYVLVTGLAVTRGQRPDGREVLRKHAPFVWLMAALVVITVVEGLLSAEGPAGRYAPGFLTMTVFYAIRLHGLTSHPPRANLPELGWAVVVVAGVLDAAYTLRLLSGFIG
jgi:hypothetical protein